MTGETPFPATPYFRLVGKQAERARDQMEWLRRETIRVEAEDREKGAIMALPLDEQVAKITFRYHELKCWPASFEALRIAEKKADFRQDDRGFEEGDMLILMEFDELLCGYTGAVLPLRVSHVERGFGIPEGFAMLSVERFEDWVRRR